MQAQEYRIAINGIQVQYYAAGTQGSPVVLLHGGGIDSARLSWGLLIPHLAERHRVIAPDFPGFGESEKPDIAYSMHTYAEFLSAFLDALNLQRPSLCGLSMGGGVALGFALDQPGRVDKLVLVDSYGLQRRVAFHKFSYVYIKTPLNGLSWALMRNRAMLRYSLAALLKRPGSVTDELVEMAYQEMLRPGAGRAWNGIQQTDMTWSGLRTCYLDRLGEITAPTLIIHGTKDSAVPPECAREAHQRISGSRLEWIEGAGHWPQRDSPEEFNRVVTQFLVG